MSADSEEESNVERYGVEDPEEYPFVASVNEALPDWVPVMGPGTLKAVVVLMVFVVGFSGMVAMVQLAANQSVNIDSGDLPNVSGPAVNDSPLDDMQSVRFYAGNISGMDDADRLLVSNNTTTIHVSLLGVDRPRGESVNPARYGLADTRANRTCLQRAEAAASEFVSRYEGEGALVAVNKTDVRRNGTVAEDSIVIVRNASVNRLMLAHGFGDAVRDAEYEERDVYVNISDRAREAGVGVWSCPGYSGGSVPVNATRGDDVGA